MLVFSLLATQKVGVTTNNALKKEPIPKFKQNGYSFDSTINIHYSINYQFHFECDFQSEKSKGKREMRFSHYPKSFKQIDLDLFNPKLKFREQPSSFKCGHFQAGYF